MPKVCCLPHARNVSLVHVFNHHVCVAGFEKVFEFKKRLHTYHVPFPVFLPLELVNEDDSASLSFSLGTRRFTCSWVCLRRHQRTLIESMYMGALYTFYSINWFTLGSEIGRGTDET